MFYVVTIHNDVPEGNIWQNAPNVEKKSKPRRKPGRWLANLTRQENGHN